MKRRNSNRWERNRAHQVADTIVRNTRRSNKYGKQISSREDRHAINQQLHTALQANNYNDLDIYNTKGCHAWLWDHYRPYIGYGNCYSQYPSGPDLIEITTEERYNLPQWVQFNICQNEGRALNRLAYRRTYNRHIDPTPLTREQILQCLEEIVHKGTLGEIDYYLDHSTQVWYNEHGQEISPRPPRLKGLDNIESLVEQCFKAAIKPKKPPSVDLYENVYYVTYKLYYRGKGDPNYQPGWWKRLQDACSSHLLLKGFRS